VDDKQTARDPGSDLAVGRVGRAHGLDGSFYVTAPQARLLAVGTVVSVAGRAAAIVRRAGTAQRPIVRLEGVADRVAAEALRGLALTVEVGLAPVLAEGEWWAHELEGCEVVDGERVLGTVTRLIELPSCEALEVRSQQGGEPLLVPMVKDAVRRVETAKGRIEVSMDFLGLTEPSPDPGEGSRRQAGRADAAREPGEHGIAS
jgi:16S rRNA processing protein RimM